MVQHVNTICLQVNVFIVALFLDQTGLYFIACFMFTNSQMQLRCDGQIGFPGGFIEHTEDISNGLNREMEEEIALEVNYYFQWNWDFLID